MTGTAAARTAWRALAAAALGRHLAHGLDQAAGARDGHDIEFVHRMRVASRRARAMLVLFADALPPRHYAWERALRRLTRALGRVRDLDVQIAAITALAVACTDRRARPGLARLRLRLEQKRARRQPRLKRDLDRLTRDPAIAAMGRWTRRWGGRPLRTGAAVNARAAAAIRAALDAFRAQAASFARPADTAGHHAARIAMKHLRYVLETFAPLAAGRLDPAVAAAHGLQSLLGDLQDSTVWLETAARFKTRERRRTERYFGHDRPFAALAPGIAWLAAHFTRRHAILLADTAAAWEEACSAGIFERAVEAMAPNDRGNSHGHQ
ncbi:MAG: CHAD domain-containing protein [Planctomycetota bacterium]